jgi:hypothetical protein
MQLAIKEDAFTGLQEQRNRLVAMAQLIFATLDAADAD